MLDPLPARDEAWLDISASSRVLTKNTDGNADTDKKQDRKVTLEHGSWYRLDPVAARKRRGVALTRQ